MPLEDLLIGIIIGGSFGIPISLAANFVWKRMQNFLWPIRIPVIRQRGENYLWDLEERGRKAKRKDGYEVIKMKKDKENLKPPKFKQVHMTRGGNDVIPLINTVGGQYLPLTVAEKENKYWFDVVEDKSAKNWGILEHQRVNEAYKPKEGFWSQYGMIVMNATFAAMVIFFVIYMSSTFTSVSGSLSSTANALTSALNSSSLAKIVSSTPRVIP